MRDIEAINYATIDAYGHKGKMYLWGGDDPSGFDCSGLVNEILKSAGVLPRKGDWTADGLYQRFIESKATYPDEGFLMFRLEGGTAVHVEYCLSARYCIGASGGGSKIRLTEEERVSLYNGLRIKFDTGGMMKDDPMVDGMFYLLRRAIEEQRAIDANAFVKIRPIPDGDNIVFVDPFRLEE